MHIAIVGAGRAGTSFTLALRRVGHHVELVHHGEVALLAPCELVLLAVPDDAIEYVAGQLRAVDGQVVAHAAGSRGLDVLGRHARVGSLHPLVPLASGERGAKRLIGATYSVAGDDVIDHVVTTLRGRILRLRDDQRPAYHAAATVCANHLVALMGHVERLAQSAGLNLEDFLPLARLALDDVDEFGPARALTGPASRGDMATIDAHLAVIPEAERSTYVAMANAAFELAERSRTQLPA
jgi:predicted short-subunit dehydrogenase-like oxidoreductase (DUF2520 family)